MNAISEEPLSYFFHSILSASDSRGKATGIGNAVLRWTSMGIAHKRVNVPQKESGSLKEEKKIKELDNIVN
jgi:hypothetical protein